MRPSQKEFEDNEDAQLPQNTRITGNWDLVMNLPSRHYWFKMIDLRISPSHILK